jgi:hypothetical protein
MQKTIALVPIFIFHAFLSSAQLSCESALEIVAGTFSFSQIQGDNPPLPVCSPGGTGASAGQWYKYIPSDNFEVRVTSDFSEINIGVDNRVQIYSGSCVALTCVAGDDDSGSGLLFDVTFEAIANRVYYIAFDNRWSNSGFTFELIEGAPAPTPEVVLNPQSFPNILGQYKIAIADMNGDYLDDIVSISSTMIHVLFQQADGSFIERATTTTPANYLPTWSMAIGDVNKDGFNDLMYGGGSGVSFFISNSTGSQYTHWAAPNFIFSQRTNFVDINSDGHLDAFVCHDLAPNVFYMNDGNNNLSFNQGGFGDHPTGGHYATIWFDYDNDGDVDLFISKCSGGGQGSGAKFNEMYRNNGDGTYTNVSDASNMNHPNQTWSSAVNDFDNDGFMDVLVGVSSFADGGHLFMRNNGDGTFSDITEGSSWDTYAGISVEFVSHDFNNDGWADIFTTGRIFLNNGDNTFTIQNVAPVVGAVGDLNNDGFLDIQNGTTVFFNQPNGNNWSKINLKGVRSNSNGIGARIEIHGEWGKQIRDVQSGTGFRFMSSLNPHFGLGQATSIDSIVVRWPSGQVDIVCNPPINSTVFIREGNDFQPNAFFLSSHDEVFPESVVAFTDVSTNCPNAWDWSILPSLGWEFVDGTDATSKNPKVKFNNSGTYYVGLVASNGPYSSGFVKSIHVVSNLTTDSYEANEFALYPNPASELLHLDFNGQGENVSLSVLSNIGSELLTFDYVPGTIDVSSLSPGAYLIALKLSNAQRITRLFIKQ